MVVIVLVFLQSSLSAQIFRRATVLLDGGVAVSLNREWNLSALIRGEYCVLDNIGPLSFGFAMYGSVPIIMAQPYVGITTNYHLNLNYFNIPFLKQFDTYAGIGIQSDFTFASDSSLVAITLIQDIGIRYFFTDFLAAYLSFRFSFFSVAPLSLGVTFKL